MCKPKNRIEKEKILTVEMKAQYTEAKQFSIKQYYSNLQLSWLI